jgi:hypothetical protein
MKTLSCWDKQCLKVGICIWPIIIITALTQMDFSRSTGIIESALGAVVLAILCAILALTIVAHMAIYIPPIARIFSTSEYWKED